MFKKTVLAVAFATAAIVATPASAQGARVGVELGVIDDDFLGTEEATYGLTAGYDFDIGNLAIGPVVGYTGLFDDDGTDIRELTAGARIGAKLGTGSMVYGTVAYANLDADGVPGSADGTRLGLGFEQNFGGLYGMVETRYTDYQYGLEFYQTVVGLGVKF
ncbi:outer membrane protein [Croceicoccus naphthovorans]|uniref:Uncharacterized protein n=1 Tax=Croceicoccus naphthovorans TaxID=1348774 RepID=A0A0G3XKM7_9SPHN|nr:outer membrane beta-barrel protein [Croceicoccus naphthovorans]AKM11129.1 hypothetical protein AB433_15965 [Croceicoccus naphthovorans]MBB3989417.1 hypothetical protein [Croceicoccus naphthovorans]